MLCYLLNSIIYLSFKKCQIINTYIYYYKKNKNCLIYLKMFTPFSFRYEPWSRFDTQSYHIITDDYCHESPVTIKAIARADGSEININ